MRGFLACAFSSLLASVSFGQSWNGYGADAQHSGVYTGSSQGASQIHWQTLLDDKSSYYGGFVLTHYASVMVSPANTVLHAFRYTTTVSGVPFFDNWRVIGRNGGSGSIEWLYNSDYSAALIFPNSWTSVFPASLCRVGTTTAMAFGGAAGSIFVKANVDKAASTLTRYPFYTTLQDFNQNQASYAPIKINTPITSDNFGNVYFGYEVTGTIPTKLASLGSGGVVKLNISTGAAVYQSISSLGLHFSLSRPSMNSSPAVTADGSAVYFALTGGDAVLVKLSTASMSPTAQVVLNDPSVPGAEASLPDVSSASPMIGPDGHVFMGVFGAQYRESHGWMLQFDGNLSPTNASGVLFPFGAFGWDDTPAAVPVSMVPSYKGSATYLILTKYNNYDFGGDAGADGSNKIAVLDPTSDSTTRDRQSGLPVMNEILTVLGPNLTHDDPQKPNARFEWCINSAAIDVKKKSAIINSEDGHMYRWSFVSNSITETLDLQPPTGEAYTCTAIGPDGQIYAVNNAILFAIGSPFLATSVSVFQGTPGHGTVQNIQYKDGLTYKTSSVASSLGQAAAIEADFALPTQNVGGLSVTSYVAAVPGSTGFIYAYNFVTKSFVFLGSSALGSAQTLVSGSTTTNGAQLVGPGGKVRIVVKAILPSHVSTSSFSFAADQINCSIK